MDNWLKEIKNSNFKKYSQFGEEGHLLFILAQIPECGKDQFLVDIGAGKNYYLSNTKHFKDIGYSGIWIDGDISELHPEIKQHWVTRENVCDLLQMYKCPHEFDLLSIDLDGNDLFILEKILVYYRPRVIVAEFNANVPHGEIKTIKYDPQHEWGKDDYFGFSFEAGKLLGKMFGYKIVYNNADHNLFFIREDLIIGLEVPEITYHHRQWHKKSNRKMIDW